MLTLQEPPCKYGVGSDDQAGGCIHLIRAAVNRSPEAQLLQIAFKIDPRKQSITKKDTKCEEMFYFSVSDLSCHF